VKGFFVTGTGTGEGKTFVTRGLAAAARQDGLSVAALKPLETGIREAFPHGEDAAALATACGRPELANWPGFYRVEPPTAPFTATLRGHAPVPTTDALVASIRAVPADISFVEGAGGVLVPIDQERTIADLILALSLPAILVARNGLGVISHVLCAHEALIRRGIHVAAVVLTEHGPRDTSQDDNLHVVGSLLSTPVHPFAQCPPVDSQLASAAAPAWATLKP
jgi:dethiobiotin synthetase